LLFIGGPGCSSVVFSLYESGPLKVVGKDVVANPDSFAEFSHLIYIDSPIGMLYVLKKKNKR
jgi:carboxypeptidase C (cathepsin A)